MNQKEIVLTGLAPSNGAFHRPVQVQKLFFLLDKNIAGYVGGPFFNFKPYNYGPFDKAVYDVLEELEAEHLIEIRKANSWREFRLTTQGQIRGAALLNQLPVRVKNYFIEVSEFVRKLSFTQLVSAIYKAYPEMKANSVFQD